MHGQLVLVTGMASGNVVSKGAMNALVTWLSRNRYWGRAWDGGDGQYAETTINGPLCLSIAAKTLLTTDLSICCDAVYLNVYTLSALSLNSMRFSSSVI